LSRSSPFVLVLSDADRAELQRRARCYSAPHAEVVRAKIVLLAACGLENTVIAARLDVHVGVVSRWRKRFAGEGMSGLADRPRSGRPRVYAAAVVAEVKAMACEPPEDRGVPQSRWSVSDLAAQAVAEGLVESVARSTVARWLDADAIRPWRYRSWIFPRDPAFEVKAARVLDLYQRIWDSADLGDDEYVISTDEKSQLQILSRCHPGLPPAPGRPGKVEFEYERHGTVAYMAAYDVHRARLMGRVEPTTGIVPFAALVDQVMTAEPYASARRVFWVADNGSSHRGQASADRMAAAWPNAVLVHLPVHASWLNQVEVVFSVIQRKVIKPSGIGDAAALAARLTRFEARYNATARPFDWKFTRAGLHDLCRRLDAHRSRGTVSLAA
jgi:transposase